MSTAALFIDWAASGKSDYLTALTQELERPGKGILDAYLKPLIRRGIGRNQLAHHVSLVSGLDGRVTDPLSDNKVLGKFSDPAKLVTSFKSNGGKTSRDDGTGAP